MIFHQNINKDTYITNKIVGNVRRAEDSNVGFASTLDIFKLFNESNLKGNPEGQDIIELSRILVDMDLAELKTGLETKMSTDDSSLRIYLELYDVQGTQVAPSGFELSVNRVTQAWDEGLGKDIVSLAHYGTCNWSQSTPDTDWSSAGGDYDIEIATQYFDTGAEDMRIDITDWVRSVWNEETVNLGLLIKFSDTLETNSYTYFLKRFATRHSRNPYLRPKLVCTWNDFHDDDRLQFEVGSENILSIKNYVKGDLSALSNVSCQLSYGTWSLSPTTVNVVSLGGVDQNGWYEATFRPIEIYGVDSDLQADLLENDEIELTEVWTSDGNECYRTTVTLKRNLVTTTEKARDYRFSLMDMKKTYTHDETPVIRLFCRDKRKDNEPVRIPIDLPSQRVERAYYRIKDFGNSTKPVVDFSWPNDDSTRLSADGNGMYFTFPTDILPHGRMFQIDILYFDRGKSYIWESNVSFSISSN